MPDLMTRHHRRPLYTCLGYTDPDTNALAIARAQSREAAFRARTGRPHAALCLLDAVRWACAIRREGEFLAIEKGHPFDRPFDIAPARCLLPLRANTRPVTLTYGGLR